MSANIKKKIHARLGHRLVVRKTIDKVRELLPPPEEVTPLKIKPKLKALKKSLEKKQNDINIVDEDILSLLEDQIENEIIGRADFDADLEEAIPGLAAPKNGDGDDRR